MPQLEDKRVAGTVAQCTARPSPLLLTPKRRFSLATAHQDDLGGSTAGRTDSQNPEAPGHRFFHAEAQRAHQRGTRRRLAAASLDPPARRAMPLPAKDFLSPFNRTSMSSQCLPQSRRPLRTIGSALVILVRVASEKPRQSRRRLGPGSVQKARPRRPERSA
jgi:hypothetical protein